jgi:DNA-binding NarL/FixJ family response regulator/AcrR family transcriptional regulator
MPQGEPLTILLVEDDPTDTALFKALLGHTSTFTQLHADSLRHAVEVLESQKVDIVVLDLGLPDSGMAATYTAMHDAAPDVPVIVLTSHDDAEAAYQALADGAQDYLVKNEVTETLLAKAIRYAIERHGALRRQQHQRIEELEVYASLAPELAGHAPASPLAETAPDELAAAVERYGAVLRHSVESGFSATEAELTVQIDDLAARFADLRATPRDLGAVHASALGALQGDMRADRFARYEDVARLLLLRFTGELANQYRERGTVEREDAGEPLPTDARDRLIDALGELLADRALDTITLDDIAAQANLSPAGVRAAVSGVREPLGALLQREFARQNELSDRLLASVPESDFTGGVGALIDAMVELWRTGRVPTAAAMAAAGDETIQALRYRHLRQLCDRALSVLSERLGLAVDDDRRAVQLALAEMVAVLDQKLLVGELFPTDQSRDEAVAELTHRFAARLGEFGVRAPAPPPPARDRPAKPRPAADDSEPGEDDDESADDGPRRLSGADYTAWADRMKQRRRTEIDALYGEEEAPKALDDKWSPERLFEKDDSE